MKIAVLSGKGGTGKTFVSVNLARIQKGAAYIDCDVECPNGHLYLKPQQAREEEVCVNIPQINSNLCDCCRKCLDFCQYTALAVAGERVLLFKEVCHACGGCALICHRGAIKPVPYPVGKIITGICGSNLVISGYLRPGGTTTLPIIRRMMEMAEPYENSVADCPPGSSCQVVQSILDADVCIVVAEASLFGIHDMKLIQQLLTLYNKPFGIVINKVYDARNYVKSFCRQNNIRVLAEIPYNKELAQIIATGGVVADEPQYTKAFEKLLKNATAVISTKAEQGGQAQ